MVFFGKRLSAAAAEVDRKAAELGFRDNLAYEDLKELLQLMVQLDVHSVLAMEANAKLCLKGKFWKWPRDFPNALNLPERFDIATWIQVLFEKKLKEELERIRKNIDMARERLVKIEARMADLHEVIASNDENFAEDKVREMMALQDEAWATETQMRNYADLNYTAFFKILKKHDKLTTGSPSMHNIMPYVELRLGRFLLFPQDDGDNDLCRNQSKVSVRKGSLGSLSSDTWLDKLDKVFEAMIREETRQPKKNSLELLKEITRGQVREYVEDRTSDADYAAVPKTSELELFQLEFWTRPLSEVCTGFSKKLRPPLFEALASGYRKESFAADLMAAIVISVAGIPKGMSYVALAGMPVESGIATLYIPSLVYALLGSSRQVAISPQSVPCLLLGGMITDILKGTAFEGDKQEYVMVAMLITMWTGIFIVVFGILGLRRLLNFISKPVLSGFISASALIAAFSTIKSLIGIHIEKSPLLHELIGRIAQHLPESQWQTSVISIGGLVFFVSLGHCFHFIRKHIPVKRLWAKPIWFVTGVPPVLWLCVAGVIVGGSLCNFNAFSQWQLDRTVRGLGSSAVAPYFSTVIKQFACEQHEDRVGASYEPVGSQEALNSVLTISSVKPDFVASDVKPSDDELFQHGVTAFNLVSSYVCPVANLPILLNTRQVSLVLDLQTVAQIFSGKITVWTDPRIVSSNPNLQWETVPKDKPIIVVTRSDGSGTTQSFAQVLGRNDSGMLVDWGAPVQQKVVSNSGMVARLASVEWSIGYTTLPQVQSSTSNLGCVALRTSAGPLSALLSWDHNEDPIFKWPILLHTYLLVPRRGAIYSDCEARRWLHSLFVDFRDNSDIASRMFFSMQLSQPDVEAILCPEDSATKSAPNKNLFKNGKCTIPSPTCAEVDMVGYISRSFSAPSVPAPHVSVPWGILLADALLLAFVSLLEHVANVQLYAEKNDYNVNLSVDLVAVGLSNVFGSMFGALVVAGGFSRTALNAPARSQLSLLMSVPISMVLVFAFAPLLSMLPQAILNTVLFVAVIHLVDFKLLKELIHLSRLNTCCLSDLAALVFAFVATGVLGVEVGMICAIAFSLSVFVYNSFNPDIPELRHVRGSTHYTSVPPRAPEIRSNVKILRFEAPLWYANIRHLLDRVRHELMVNGKSSQPWHALILDMSSVSWMDATASSSFKKLFSLISDTQFEMCLCGLHDDLKALILGSVSLPESIFFASVYEAEVAIETRLAHRNRQQRGGGSSGLEEELEIVSLTSGTKESFGSTRAFPNTISSRVVGRLIGRSRVHPLACQAP